MTDHTQNSPAYQWLLHPDSACAVADYRQQLAEQGLEQAGAYLRDQLRDQAPDSLSDAAFLECLVRTKRPLIFVESAVYGDGRDWSTTELSLLGNLGVAVPVRIFDDGRHHRPAVHPEPLSATLLFIPGALLRNGRGCVPADWQAVTQDGQLDPAGYRALYERRLLPLLRYADLDAAERGQTALITVPGLGCGQFAGPFAGRLGEELKGALIAVLQRHAPQLPHSRLIYYDPYSECRNERHDVDALSLRVRPLLQGNAERPQLCAPTHYAEAGDELSDCRLYSIVAWDQVSWPGNDYWGGARMTDDGVKAAASDLMRVITGVDGAYDARASGYQPPEPYSTWEALVQDRGTRLQL
ncbi:MAG: hypothetical protein VBE63_15010, partial [Lamprobacter sp.]|uniref:hypothetical protein n=1 Tax=Lamprobacter sp. TaxID=3100796 RepID=UPI002B25BF23